MPEWWNGIHAQYLLTMRFPFGIVAINDYYKKKKMDEVATRKRS